MPPFGTRIISIDSGCSGPPSDIIRDEFRGAPNRLSGFPLRHEPRFQSSLEPIFVVRFLFLRR